MAGQVQRVIGPTVFNFDNLASTKLVAQWVALHVPVANWESAEIAVRVHDSNFDGVAEINVTTHADGFTMDDPAAEYIETTSLSTAIDVSTATYQVESLTGDMGSMIAVKVEGTGGDTLCNATLSIDLVLRSS